MATPEITLTSEAGLAVDPFDPKRIDENLLQTTGTLDMSKKRTALRLPDGGIVHIATALLMDQTRRSEIPASDAPDPSGEIVIPLVEERLEIEKKLVQTGRVTLEKKIQSYEETLDVPLVGRSFEIERVVLNQPVDRAPAVRQEGLTTIYPLVEEQLVITTQLILKEELRVTQHDTERRDTRTVTLKRESIDVTRTPFA